MNFFGVLTLIFIVLKLMGYIAWSWLWVLSPILIPLALFLLGGILLGFKITKKNPKRPF